MKVHALIDVLGRPLRLVLTPSNTSDVKGADLLIGETIGMKRVIADAGYDAIRVRANLREQGTIPVGATASARSTMGLHCRPVLLRAPYVADVATNWRLIQAKRRCNIIEKIIRENRRCYLVGTEFDFYLT